MDMSWFALSSAGYAYIAFSLSYRKRKSLAFLCLAGTVAGLVGFVIIGNQGLKDAKRKEI